MTKDELSEVLSDLDENVTIIVCDKDSQIPVAFKSTGERVTKSGKVYYFLRNPLGLIVTVWIALLALAPEWTPTFPVVLDAVTDEISEVLALMEWGDPVKSNVDGFLRIDGMLPSGELDVLSSYNVPLSSFEPDFLSNYEG